LRNEEYKWWESCPETPLCDVRVADRLSERGKVEGEGDPPRACHHGRARV